MFGFRLELYRLLFIEWFLVDYCRFYKFIYAQGHIPTNAPDLTDKKSFEI